ncbi:hypothetical protein LSH36_76g06021 [Paralvinella palmiformis]|uniref:EGF domain-specific O-linked N-acetylglucosamine transferase n=1 Tax=Paralvinella palmiformis TaxID=53620 RepID=A0AAD9K2D0_9ANNE|nr:hypothetical protein LSH36_76g06021 [Paralvinella palmiformis]
MTVHRFIYKICWRNKIVLPLFLLLSVLIALAVIFQDASFEYSPDGKLQIKYRLVPKSNSKWLVGDGQKSTFVSPDKEIALVWKNDHLQIDSDSIFGHSHSTLAAVGNDVRIAHVAEGAVTNLVGTVHQRISLDKLQDTEWARLSGRNQRRRKKKSHLKFKPVWSRSLYYNQGDPPEQFKVWRTYTDNFCDGQFIGYFNEFAHLRNVIVDKGLIISERTGGEKLQDVINQPEEAEYFSYDEGAFEQKCKNGRPSYYFNNNNHMNDWLYSLQSRDMHPDNVDFVQNEFVIAIVRYEYVNIYHTMSDWYNAFLMMQFFNKTQWETNIVLFDAHPQGSLDSTWHILFNTTRRISVLPKRTLFSNMVWNILGYNSPMLDHYGPGMPLIEEFRNFFLMSFDISGESELNCAELNVLFIWRRDYVAHPRNPTGTISRKIYNEKELMKSVQEKYPTYRIRGMQIDMFDMRKQLSAIVSTDILIGMHGAGLTHSLFLPAHAAVIEMIPNYWSAAFDHFYAISKWRNLIYKKWSNEDPHNEVPNGYTKIPTGVVHSLLKSVIKEMCHKVAPIIQH